MSFSDSYHPTTGKAPAADADSPHHHNPPSPDGGKPRCQYEGNVVVDGTTSRMVLVFLRDLFENHLQPNSPVEEFPCPMLRCLETFKEPLAFVQHLLSCPCLSAGEFRCMRCNAWHIFPTNETGWSAFSGWKPQTGLRQKRSFGSKMKDLRSKLVTPRNSGRHGSGSISSGSVASFSPISSAPSPTVHKRPSGDWFYDYEVPQYQPPTSSPVEYPPEKGGSRQDKPRESTPAPSAPLELPGPTPDQLPREMEAQVVYSELADSAASQDSLLDLRNHGQLNQRTHPQGIHTPAWSSYDSTLSSHGAFPKKIDEHAAISAHTYLVSPQSSIDSPTGRAPVSRQPSLGVSLPEETAQTQFVDGGLTESPVDMDKLQGGGQAWATPVSNHANSHGSSWNFDISQSRLASQVQMLAHVQGGVNPSTSRQGLVDWGRNDDAVSILAYEPLQRGLAGHSGAVNHGHSHNHYVDSIERHALGGFDPLKQSLHGGNGHSVWLGEQANTLAAASSLNIDISPHTLAADHVEPDATREEMLGDIDDEEMAGAIGCDECSWKPKGKKRNFRGYLRKHKKTHIGVKLPCPYPGCDRTFSRPDNLKTHREKHNASSFDPAIVGGSAVGGMGVPGGGILKRQADFFQGKRRALLKGQKLI